MKPAHRPKRTGTRLSIPAIGLAAVLAPVSLLFISSAYAAASAVPLGSTSTFGVLAGAGITDTGPTTVNGDIGSYPTISITGTGSMTINGTNHGGDAVTQQAKTDLVTAYNNASGQGPTSPITSDLGGQTLVSGIYKSTSSVGLTGTLTLNGGGNASAVFVFQAGSTLTTATASQVVLINGAQACNVFWQIGSSATLGTYSSFLGTILAAQSITVTTGVTIGGRVLAQGGAVTLDTDTITTPSCTTPPTTTTTVPPATRTTVLTTTPTTVPATGTKATTVPTPPTTSPRSATTTPDAKTGSTSPSPSAPTSTTVAVKKVSTVTVNRVSPATRVPTSASSTKVSEPDSSTSNSTVPTAPMSPIGTTSVAVTG